MQEMNSSVIDQFLTLAAVMPKKLFIDNMTRQIKNYTINQDFLLRLQDYLGDWVSYGNIKNDTIEYLLCSNLFNYDKWLENSKYKDKDILTNDKFREVYGDKTNDILNNIGNVKYNILTYFLDAPGIDCDTKRKLLLNYNDDKPIIDYICKYSNLLGRNTLSKIKRVEKENLFTGGDIYDKMFLTGESVNILLFLDVISMGIIPLEKINSVFENELFFSDNINDSYEDRDPLKSLDNIRQRYGLDIYFKFIKVLGKNSPKIINDQDFLLDLLRYEIPEDTIFSIKDNYISTGLYTEIYNYAEKHNYKKTIAALLVTGDYYEPNEDEEEY